jgi:hypothetical protein
MHSTFILFRFWQLLPRATSDIIAFSNKHLSTGTSNVSTALIWQQHLKPPEISLHSSNSMHRVQSRNTWPWLIAQRLLGCTVRSSLRLPSWIISPAIIPMDARKYAVQSPRKHRRRQVSTINLAAVCRQPLSGNWS